MPRYLLKSLFISILVIGCIVGVIFGVSILISARLNSTVDAARAQGYAAGITKGYDAGLNLGSEAGYQQGSKFGLAVAGNNTQVGTNETGYFFMYNPTYQEIITDLANNSELTDAQQILDWAKANGIRAAYVRVPIARPASAGRIYLYQLVAFDTVDKGLIIIEPASHREVKVEVGKSYNALNGFPPSNYDDTITKVTIVW